MLQNRIGLLTNGLTAMLIGGVALTSVSVAAAAPAEDARQDVALLDQIVSPRDLWGFDWEWRRTETIDGNRLQPDDPTRYTLDFSPDGTIHVQADCNIGDGTYNYEQWMLGVELSKVSKIRCPNGSHSAVFLRDLGTVVAQAADGDDLVLLMRTGGVMRFGRSSEAFLGGPRWLLSQYLASDGRYHSPEDGLNVSLRFGVNDDVLGNMGCNSFRGRYVQQDNTIDFRNMVASSRFCGEYAMAFERGFRTYLSRASFYWQIDNQLTFLDENHQPLMIFER